MSIDSVTISGSILVQVYDDAVSEPEEYTVDYTAVLCETLDSISDMDHDMPEELFGALWEKIEPYCLDDANAQARGERPETVAQLDRPELPVGKEQR